MMLYSRSEQQRRDRSHHMVGVAVGEHEEIAAVGDGLVDFGEDLLQTGLQGIATAGDLIQSPDHIRLVIASEL